MDSIAADTRWLDATDQAALVARHEVTALELLDAAIERIETLDPQIGAVNIRWFEHAREVATGIDAGDRPGGAFRGVPFLLKDLWAAYEGQLLSNGNRALKHAAIPSPSDTTLVARCRAAGLVTAGRTTSPEFGAVPTTEPECWPPTRNPWDTSRSAGGSSGGAAAAVAAGMVPIAHASDGGGSIRIPASVCGLVGLKPSQGRITLGPLRDESNLGVELCVSRTVRDTARFLDAVRGPGVGDTVIAPAPVRPYVDELGAPVGRLRIGMLDTRADGSAIDPECRTAVLDAARLLDSLGHDVAPAFPAALADPDVSRRFSAMWSTNMAVSMERIAATIGRPVTADDVELMNWVQAEFARNVSGVDYALALAAVSAFRRQIQSWWRRDPSSDDEGYDLLLTPTLAEPPLPLGTFANDPDRPMAPLLRSGPYVPFTPAFNMSGQPAISLPLHRTATGLPIGIHLVAAYGREDVLIRVASQLEQAAPWAHLHPPV